MLGYKLTGNWATREIVVVTYSDSYTFSILEQLLFRLSTLEVTPTVYIINKLRKGTNFTKKEVKSGGYLFGGDGLDRDDYFYDLMSRFPQVSFVKTRETNLEYKELFKNSTNKRSVISLGIDLSQLYYSFIKDNIDNHELEFVLNDGDTRKYIQFMYGLNTDGVSEVELKFSQLNGLLTPGINSAGYEYNEPNRVDQTHEIRMMVNLMVNDLLTERYINYTSMAMVDDEIVKQRLVLPTLSYLEQTYIIGEGGVEQDTLNGLLSQLESVPEGYHGFKGEYSEDIDNTLINILGTVSRLLRQQGKHTMGNLFSNVSERINRVNNNELKGRWLQVALMVQQSIIFDQVYEREVIEDSN